MAVYFPLLSKWADGGAMRSYRPSKAGAAPKIVRPAFEPAPAPKPIPRKRRPLVGVTVAREAHGEIKLIGGVTEPEAAMVMAIVADELKCGLGELQFESIRLLEA